MQSVRIPDGPNGGLRAGDGSTRSYSGPEVGFEDITIDLPEARFWPTVAVGTTIADRPPAQIRTSAFTHTALTGDGWRQSGRQDRDVECGVEESTD